MGTLHEIVIDDEKHRIGLDGNWLAYVPGKEKLFSAEKNVYDVRYPTPQYIGVETQMVAEYQKREFEEFFKGTKVEVQLVGKSPNPLSLVKPYGVRLIIPSEKRGYKVWRAMPGLKGLKRSRVSRS